MEMQLFTGENGFRVRTVLVDGEPWFVAKDVAEVLGYDNPRDAVLKHCKGGRKTRLPTTGGDQDITILPERDLYRLVMRSKLPSAERFEEWVVGSVLPSIRRTGSYSNSLVVTAPLSRLEILQMALEAEQKVVALESQVEAAKPAVEFVAKYVDASASKCIGDVAKVLTIKPSAFFVILEKKRILFKRLGTGCWIPFQEYLDKGFFEVKTGEKHGHAFTQTKFTPAGIEWIARKIGEINAKAVVA